MVVNHQISGAFGGTGIDSGRHVTARSDGLITIAGLFNSQPAKFGGTSVNSNGDFDPFVVDIDGSTGAVTNVRSLGGTNRDEAHGVASTAETLVFAGSFGISIDVLNQTFTSMGGLDGYVVRLKR